MNQPASMLERVLRSQAFETGMHHPAVDFLREAWTYDPEGIEAEVGRILSVGKWRGPDLIRCLAWVPAAAGPGLRWVADALKHEDADWRDAAIYALEHWETPAGWDLLRQHEDPDPHLASYARDLLAERGLA